VESINGDGSSNVEEGMTQERGNQRCGDSASSSHGASVTGGACSAIAMAKWAAAARSSGGRRRKGWKLAGPNWAVQTEWTECSSGLWEEDDEGLGPANRPKGRDGLGRLLRLGRCRGKQRKWFGLGKRF
jgi:hypothetical protein